MINGTTRSTGLDYFSLAVDAYASVVAYGEEIVREHGIGNIAYVRGDRAQLPIRESAVDAVVCCWAELDRVEAARVLRPGGLLVHMAGHPTEPGELTPILATKFPLVPPVADASLLDPGRPPEDGTTSATEWWPDVTLVGDELKIHDFTFIADYGSAEEAAAIFGRLFGQETAAYLRQRRQSTVWSRLRIWYGRVAK